METEAEFDTPCSSMAVDSILRVGTAGVLWGLCTAPHDAAKLVHMKMWYEPVDGLYECEVTLSCLLCSACTSIAGFAIGGLGLICLDKPSVSWRNDLAYDDVVCVLLEINSAAAGAIAGAVIAASTRSRKHVAVMAALLSVVCAAGDYSRTF
ncbi:hypothetical protein Cgig2_002693 [Carnegiea gigantea]|uniref:Uncharacterized protein n=1 Tax=Carnegiea gigantea TaxID=171969 RepID=A0A9Q1GP40_9CARY|nr:hypothetical protein Cgig2_002693 [Carnegiea gigantea]